MPTSFTSWGQAASLESGSHAELLARGGRYAQSWAQQLRETEKGQGDRTPCDGGLTVARFGCTIFVCWYKAMTAGEWREFAQCADAKRIQRICLDGQACAHGAWAPFSPMPLLLPGRTHAGSWRASGNLKKKNPERCCSMLFVSTRIANALRELAAEMPVSLRVSGECMAPCPNLGR